MSRFSNILSAAMKPAAKPGLEGEDAAKVSEAPLSPTEVTAAKPEDGEGAKAKDGEQPASPTEVVAATPENKDGPADNLPTASSDAASTTAEPKVTSSEEVGKVEIAFEEDGEILAEVVAADAELDKGNDAMDTMQDASQRLAVVETRLEDSLAEGGLDPVAASFMQDNVDNIAERLEDDEVVYPAVESFGGESMRYASTVASLEAVKEFAGRVGAGIQAVLEKVKAFLKGLIAKLVQYFGSVKQRNEELKKRLGATGARTVTGNDTVDIGAVLGRVSIGDSPSLEGFGKLPGLLDDTRTFDAAQDASLSTDYQNIVDLYTKPGDTLEKIGQYYSSKESTSTGLVPKAFHNKSEVNGGEQYRTDVLPGNVVLALTQNRGVNSDGPVGVIERVSAAIGRNFRFERLQEGDGEKSGEAKVLSIDEMKKIATVTDAILANGAKITQQANLDKLAFKDVSVAEGVSKEQANAAKALSHRFAQRLGHAHQVSAKTLAYCARVAASFQTYAFKSLETYA